MMNLRGNALVGFLCVYVFKIAWSVCVGITFF